MKVRQEHIHTLKGRLTELVRLIEATQQECDRWLEIQRERELYKSTDEEWARVRRRELEDQLDEFRSEIGDIYDFMSERGLRQIA